MDGKGKRALIPADERAGDFAMPINFVTRIAAVAALLIAAPALAQIQTIDPNQAVADYQPAQDASTDADQPAPYGDPDPYQPAPDAQVPLEQSDYTPIDPVAPEPEPLPEGRDGFEARNIPVNQNATVPASELLTAAEGVFGRGARGLARLMENILRDQGEPVAYIAGQEASAAFVFGLRYGSGRLHHQVEGVRPVFWTGPSVGFDVGGDAAKVFVLVYNLHDSQRLFRRYLSGEGHLYAVGGFSAQYLRRGDVVLIPIRLGVGWRAGVNAGYMRFSERSRWLPF